MATILHISDLHFGTDHFYQPADGVSLLDVLTDDLAHVHAKPDCVVISGDLTTHGEKEGLEKAVAFIKGLASQLRLPLSSFVIVPGNHEVDWKAVENQEQKVGHTGRDLASAGLVNFKKLVLETVYTTVRDEFLTTYWSGAGVFVLGLNSCHFEGKNYSGVGFVPPEQLKWARAELQKEWKDCPARIAVLHHHLVPVTHSNFRPDPDKKRISITLNAPDILKWLADNGFQIVLHGHQHQPFSATEVRHSEGDRTFAVTVLGAGSAGVRADRLGWIAKNHYQLLEVADGRVGVRSRIRHSNAPGAFEDYRSLALPLEPPQMALQLKVGQIGLQDFHWFDEVPWSDYFAKATSVETFALTAGLLVRDQIGVVREFLGKDGAKLTLLLYDSEDVAGLELFDRHFDENSGTRARKIEDVLRDIKKLRDEPETRATVDVRFIRDPLNLKYTYYKFDDTVLYVPYRIKSKKEPREIPVFVLRPGELLKNYLFPDSEFLLKASVPWKGNTR